jgi:prohibitin 2
MNANWKSPNAQTITVYSRRVLALVMAVVLLILFVVFLASSTYIVDPGTRGVAVTLGKVSPGAKNEGFGFKEPFFTTIHLMSVRQQTRTMPAECYSSDLQQVKMQVKALYRVPERSVVTIFQQYAGEPFDNLIAPRIQEALKEVAATHSAEQIVKRREQVKLDALELARKKIGDNFLELVDLVLYNITLSPELEQAIELKMVQEQEAAKAKFTQLKAQIEADTAIIRAKGEAEAIAVRGQALRANPAFVKLEMVQNWNGRAPMVVGADNGGSMLLQSSSLPPPSPPTRQQHASQPTHNAPTRSPRAQ